MSTPLPPPSPTTLLAEPGLPARAPESRPRTPGGVVLRVLGGLLVLAMVAGGVSGLLDDWFHTSETSTVPVAGDGTVTSIRVDIDSGDVVLTPGPLQVTRTARFGLHRPTFSVQVADGQLVLKSRCDVFGFVPFSRCGTDLTIALPETMPIVVSSGAGDVHVTGTAGTVKVSSGAGDIRVDDVRGPLDLSSGAGDIRGRSVRSLTVKAHSGAGDVSMQFAEAPQTVDVDSGAGDLTVVVPADQTTYRLDVDTGAGDRNVDIRSDPAAERRIRAHSGAGDVSIRYPR